MGTWNRDDFRKDLKTAAHIDHGLAMQGIAGPAAAYSYLLQCGVPALIAKRVLASPLARRPLGLISVGGSAQPQRS